MSSVMLPSVVHEGTAAVLIVDLDARAVTYANDNVTYSGSQVTYG